MKTQADNNWPEIDWEITGKVLSRDPEEREVIYLAKGSDKEGKKYTGNAKYVCGEYEGITEIEQE